VRHNRRMAALSEQRCFQHPSREAAARCPSCRRFFCRECVTEHEGRLICRACMAAQTAAPPRPGRGLADAGVAAGSLFGFLLAWILFYYLGLMLTRIPAEFHTGL